jgi:hypothetical protein
MGKQRGVKIKPLKRFRKENGKYYLYVGIHRFSSTKFRHIVKAYIKYQLGFKEWYK